MSEVVDAVRELQPVLRERAQETEDLRKVPAESIESLRQTGFFRILQPALHGGLEADPLDFYRSVRLISSACGSTGWVSSVLGCHPWQLGLFPAQAQQDVWGEDQDTRISSSYAPMGRATPVDGGFRFSGRWSFSSGCDHASWVFLGGLVLGDDGNPVDFRTFLLPISDYKIEDVWDTVGLRGTGSNDILVDDVFVPEYRTLSFMDTGKCVCPGHEVNTGPLYKLPFASVFSYSIAAPVVGMATGAYETHVSYMQERVRASYGNKAAEDPYSQVRVAEAASDIDAAWLQLEHNIGTAYKHVVAGEKVPFELRMRIRRDQVKATARAIGAVDRLFENSGGKALNAGTPIQRFWRDAHAGRVHAINDPERALAMYGKTQLGLKVQDAWL